MAISVGTITVPLERMTADTTDAQPHSSVLHNTMCSMRCASSVT